MTCERTLLCGLSAAALLAAAPAVVHAADSTTVGEVVITADKAGLLERKPTTTVLGLTKPLIETPRAASLINDTTIQRYGIQTINDLVAISPSSYTASFYGVPGSLDVRGTLADNYFLGFRLIENRGTYSTPIGDASQIDVVRGPPSPIYGPGKVGGFLNFVPKSIKSESLTRPVGEIDVTGGSYGKKNISAQAGAPMNIGTAEGGIYAYGEVDDSDSFYEGIHPKHQLGEVSVDYSLPGGWETSFDALVYHSTGDVQTPGWNRLTPQLISSQTYVTGQNTSLSPSPGVGYLTPNQATMFGGPYPNNFTAVGGGLYAGYFGGTPSGPPLPDFQLNSAGAGSTVKLSPRDVFISPADFSKTFMPALVGGITKDLPNDASLKLQLFYNGLDNQRFVSYGYPAWFRSNTIEARLTYDFKLSGWNGLVTADTIAGLSWRYYQGRDMQSFDSGVIAVDRRDLSKGATPTDTLCDPFTAGVTGDQTPANCLGWESDVHSREREAGVFFTTDITVASRLDLVLGARYDDYNVHSSDTGILADFDYPAGYAAGTPVSGSKDDTTYSASATYKLGWGLMPYVTYARSGALEVQQAGDLTPGQLLSNGYLSSSDLTEGGIKFQLLNHTIVGALDDYLQDRTALTGLNNVTQRSRSNGVELEVRWLATKNLSFTFSGDVQHTEVLGPDTGTYYVPAYAVCGANLTCELNSWGGAYLVFNFAQSPLGHPGDYKLTTVPDSVASLYANYITDKYEWGQAGVTVGATHVSQTSGTIVGAVVYPAYWLANASAFYKWGPYEADLNIDNLFDKLYFTPNSDPTYVNVAVIPSVGREWRLTLKRRF